MMCATSRRQVSQSCGTVPALCRAIRGVALNAMARALSTVADAVLQGYAGAASAEAGVKIRSGRRQAMNRHSDSSATITIAVTSDGGIPAFPLQLK